MLWKLRTAELATFIPCFWQNEHSLFPRPNFDPLWPNPAVGGTRLCTAERQKCLKSNETAQESEGVHLKAGKRLG